MEEGVEALQDLAAVERDHVERRRVGLALADVALDLRLQGAGDVLEEAPRALLLAVRLLPLLLALPRGIRALGRLLVAVDEVDDARDLVGRQLAEEREAHVPVAREVGERERGDEDLLVVADLALGEVPGGEPGVEARVALRHLLVERPQGVEVAVGRREERVQDREADVVLGHRASSPGPASEKTRSPASKGRRARVFLSICLRDARRDGHPPSREDRPLRGPGRDRPRRHGHRLPGARAGPPRGRTEDAPQGGSGRLRAVRARAPAPRLAGRGARLRRSPRRGAFGRRGLARHAFRAGRDVEEAARVGAARRPGDDRPRRRARPRARSRPRARDRPPGREARERPLHGEGTRAPRRPGAREALRPERDRGEPCSRRCP